MGLVTTKLDTQNKLWVVRRLYKNKSKMHFDLAIQRNSVWKDEKKSLWIHSLLYGFPFPNVYAKMDDNGDMWFLDGKQRLTTTLQYIDEEFILANSTPDIPIDQETAEEIEEEAVKRDINWTMEETTIKDDNEDELDVVMFKIAGLNFSELPKIFQDTIMDQNFSIVTIKGLSVEERDIMFQRLNGGEPLKPIELTRVYAGSLVMDYIHNEVAINPFFRNTINLSDSSRNRMTDENIILQVMYVIDSNKDVEKPRGVGLSSSVLRNYASRIKQEGLSNELKQSILNTTEYLNKSFLATEDYLKKIHVPIIFLLAHYKAIPQDIVPEKFGGFIQQFFAPFENSSKISKNRNQLRYSDATRESTAKAEQVSERINHLFAEYDEKISTAPNYQIPEPKVSSNRSGKRGRPKKNNIEEAVQQSDNQLQEEQENQLQQNVERQNSPMFEDGVVVTEDNLTEGDQEQQKTDSEVAATSDLSS